MTLWEGRLFLFYGNDVPGCDDKQAQHLEQSHHAPPPFPCGNEGEEAAAVPLVIPHPLLYKPSHEMASKRPCYATYGSFKFCISVPCEKRRNLLQYRKRGSHRKATTSSQSLKVRNTANLCVRGGYFFFTAMMYPVASTKKSNTSDEVIMHHLPSLAEMKVKK